MHATCGGTKESEREWKRTMTHCQHFNFFSSVILSQRSSHCQALPFAFHLLPGGFGDEVWH